jgi:hypothetical protein
MRDPPFFLGVAKPLNPGFLTPVMIPNQWETSERSTGEVAASTAKQTELCEGAKLPQAKREQCSSHRSDILLP